MEGKNLDFPWSTIPGAYYILQVKFITKVRSKVNDTKVSYDMISD